MAELSSVNSFLGCWYDNKNAAEKKLKLLTEPVMLCELPESYSTWKQEVIELPNKFTFKAKRRFSFTFPRNGLLDPQSLRLSFNLRFVRKPKPGQTELVNDTSTHWVTFDVSTIFSECSLYLGKSQLLHRQVEYGKLRRRMATVGIESQMNNGDNKFRALMCGYGRNDGVTTTEVQGRVGYHGSYVSVSNRQLMTEVARRYLVDISMGLFCQKRPIYLDAFHDSLMLEFALADTDIAAVSNLIDDLSTWGDLEMEVGYPKLHYTRYLPLPALNTQLQEALNAGAIVYQYLHWEHQRIDLPKAVNRHEVDIRIHHKWLRYVYAEIRCDSDRSITHDSFQTYISLDPYANAANTILSNDHKHAKESCIKRYYWLYNGRQYPEFPIEVLTTRPEPEAVDYATGTVKPTPNFQDYFPLPVDLNKNASPSVEAWYYMEQFFLHMKSKYLQSCRRQIEAPCMGFDWNSSLLHMQSGSETQSNNTIRDTGRLPVDMCLVGQFSESTYDGRMECVSGGHNNDSLKLIIEYNGVSSRAYEDHYPMYLDVFVGYDNALFLSNDGFELRN